MLRALLADRLKLAAHFESREEDVFVLEMARPDGALGPRIKPETTADCRAAQAAAQAERDAKRGVSFEEELVAAIRTELAGGQPKPLEFPRVICSIRHSAAGDVEAHSVSMHLWLTTWTGLLGRPIVDRTGLKETYSFKLTYSPADPLISRSPRQATEPAVPDGRPMLQDALRDQLGLKLTAGRGPVEFLVVDRVEPPTLD